MSVKSFEARNLNYSAQVRESFAKQGAMNSLRAEIVELAPGRLILGMPFQDAFTQQHGFVHAGIISSLLDTACGFAAFSLMEEGAGVLTAEFKTSLLAPARGERFTAVAEVVRSGRTLTFCEARAFAETDGSSTLIATMSATLIAIYGRQGIRG